MLSSSAATNSHGIPIYPPPLGGVKEIPANSGRISTTGFPEWVSRKAKGAPVSHYSGSTNPFLFRKTAARCRILLSPKELHNARLARTLPSVVNQNSTVLQKPGQDRPNLFEF